MVLIMLVCNLYYVDQPYLGVPEHAEFDIELRFGPEGEILGFFTIGVWDRFSMGVSYGASNLIGAGDPDFYEIPGIQIRIMAIEHGFFVPEILLGFDNQGYGGYSSDTGRYAIMSKGLYGQLGKVFSYSGIEVVPSLGANYCFEDENRFDIFCGMKIQFGAGSALLADYSPNFNDDADNDKGYLNVSLKLIFYEELFFEVALRDLLDNSPNELQFNRMIRLGYEQIF